MSPSMPHTLAFARGPIEWRQLGDFPHFRYTVLGVDEAREIADFVLTFVPNERIFLHRHRALTTTVVVQGEHRLYEAGGAVKEIRPLGSMTLSPASDEPHREGGGAEGAIVIYSTRGSTGGVVFEVLDDDGGAVGVLNFSDFIALFEAQGRVAGG